ncbi:MAG TPA: helicase-related protein [Bryobacteraceae bacterium]|nr:helicase-related protein [Bryobacteraceae bacterium]
MPVYEVYPVTRDLAHDPGGKVTDSDILSLQRLADSTIPIKVLCAELRSFVARYRRWINCVETEVKKVPRVHRNAATRILGRLHLAADRMERGVKCLENNPKVTKAFRMATRAMLMQMVHSGRDYGGSTRNRDERPFKEPAYSGAAVLHLRWFPFQLAFQLLTLESVVEPTAAERELVDLIWFPTGGGKTEAYLWVAALEMFLRRLRHGDKGAGTAVIKRYTLRLLTSQQFQRAAALICACERLRLNNEDLGETPFTLGLWIGGQSSANSFSDAMDQYRDMIDDARPENPFQLQRCPWCGTRIVPEEQEQDAGFYGVRSGCTHFDFYCPTASCPFHERLPVAVVDEELYLRPPSMLIGTIDKFARLAWDHRSRAFFGGNCLPPGLIIQDELHLISGPLGTIAGIYEAAIDCLLTRGGHRPKIIAATATIRRAADQAERLYARPIAVFPPSGLSADDSYFARTNHSAPGRLYIGVMGQGHTPVTSVVRASAAVCQSPQELKSLCDEAKDGYWTVLIYHNSKRELGKTMALARDDIPARIKVIAADESNLRPIENVEELSANLPGRRIPEVLLQLERRRGEDAVDILPCTNMISVGVDVKRLGIMIIVGQPKTTAEYIQATSRVGRDQVPGLVITMYSPTKPRDRSHYESFRSYHEAVYRWVEPTSVTPFALPARERALHAALVILARHAAGLADNGAAQLFDPSVEPMKSLIEWLISRTSKAEPAEGVTTERHLRRLVDEWASRASLARARKTGPLVYDGSCGKQFEPLLCTFENPKPNAWRTLNSMRHVDSEALIWVNGEREA